MIDRDAASYSAASIACMREWLVQFEWEDVDSIGDLTDQEVVRAIDAHYSAGLADWNANRPTSTET